MVRVVGALGVVLRKGMRAAELASLKKSGEKALQSRQTIYSVASPEGVVWSWNWLGLGEGMPLTSSTSN